jgi:sugar O-acyltransferase (sialic acid O-acetyltransferase NeuD family)
MGPTVILGFSENIIALVLETLKDRGENGPFSIIQNIQRPANGDIPFLPEGIEISMEGAWQNPVFPQKGRYIFGVGGASVKEAVFEYFRHEHQISRTNYASLVHRSSVIASSVVMDKGCYIEPQSVISPFSKLGFGVTINRNVSIGHHSVLGDFVTIYPGVNIAGHVHIGCGSQIGMGTAVFDHVRIGANATIGGGSVVNRDIPDNVIAWGNPCKVIRNKDLA